MITLNQCLAPFNGGCREIESIVIIQDGSPSVTTYIVKLTRIAPSSDLVGCLISTEKGVIIIIDLYFAGEPRSDIIED